MSAILHHLGHSGISTRPLVLGGNVFGWTADEARSFELLDAFAADGFNFIDTADVYSKWVPGHTGGESETIIGKWMKQKKNRHKMIIATKVGMEMGPGRKGLSRAYILDAVNHSLARLHTDYIDLYQAHQDDPSTPLEETLDAFAQLIHSGKVRAIGASNYSAKRLREALAISARDGLPRFESLQPLYNLYDRQEFEEALEALCLDEVIGVIPYFSLAVGFLTGKYRSEADLSKSPRGDRVKRYLEPRGFRILVALDDISKRISAPPSQVALAWLISQASVTAPIASATSLEQLKDLLAATQLTLDNAALEQLEKASAL